jgi:hypothetical protein
VQLVPKLPYSPLHISFLSIPYGFPSIAPSDNPAVHIARGSRSGREGPVKRLPREFSLPFQCLFVLAFDSADRSRGRLVFFCLSIVPQGGSARSPCPLLLVLPLLPWLVFRTLGRFAPVSAIRRSGTERGMRVAGTWHPIRAAKKQSFNVLSNLFASSSNPSSINQSSPTLRSPRAKSSSSSMLPKRLSHPETPIRGCSQPSPSLAKGSAMQPTPQNVHPKPNRPL